MVTWTEKYSVKVARFDDQHKQLFRLIDELHQGMKNRQVKEKMGGILNELLKYTKSHFAQEEQALLAIGYPDLACHCAEHKKFTSKIEEMINDFSCGVAGISIELMEFLNKWLANHILQTDHAYVPMMTGSN